MDNLKKTLDVKKLAAIAGAFFLLVSQVSAQSRSEMVNNGFWTNEPYAWYAQPWIWSLVAGVIVMVILVITKGGNKQKMEPESEEGTVHE